MYQCFSLSMIAFRQSLHNCNVRIILHVVNVSLNQSLQHRNVAHRQRIAINQQSNIIAHCQLLSYINHCILSTIE